MLLNSGRAGNLPNKWEGKSRAAGKHLLHLEGCWNPGHREYFSACPVVILRKTLFLTFVLLTLEKASKTLGLIAIYECVIV